jgi:hypothetical protein
VYALTWGLQPLGNLVIGWLAEVTDAPLALVVGGLVSVLGMALFAWRSRQLREMD